MRKRSGNLPVEKLIHHVPFSTTGFLGVGDESTDSVTRRTSDLETFSSDRFLTLGYARETGNAFFRVAGTGT